MSTPKPYINGHHIPAPDEIDAVSLTVRGTIPPSSTGAISGTGPTPSPGSSPATGSAAAACCRASVCPAVARSGTATGGYTPPRSPRTRQFRGEIDQRTWRQASPPRTSSRSAAGSWPLHEASLPWQVSPELETIGVSGFKGGLRTSMTARAKEDPITGELHFLSCSPSPPHVVYYTASPAGEITRRCGRRRRAVPYARLRDHHRPRAPL